MEALEESDAELRNPRLTLNGRTLSLPATLHTGDYAEFLGEDAVNIYNENGHRKQSIPVKAPLPSLKGGDNALRIDGETSSTVKWTQITLGEPLK